MLDWRFEKIIQWRCLRDGGLTRYGNAVEIEGRKMTRSRRLNRNQGDVRRYGEKENMVPCCAEMLETLDDMSTCLIGMTIFRIIFKRGCFILRDKLKPRVVGLYTTHSRNIYSDKSINESAA